MFRPGQSEHSRRVGSADRYLVGAHLRLVFNTYGKYAEQKAQNFADMLKGRARGQCPVGIWSRDHPGNS